MNCWLKTASWRWMKVPEVSRRYLSLFLNYRENPGKGHWQFIPSPIFSGACVYHICSKNTPLLCDVPQSDTEVAHDFSRMSFWILISRLVQLHDLTLCRDLVDIALLWGSSYERTGKLPADLSHPAHEPGNLRGTLVLYGSCCWLKF